MRGTGNSRTKPDSRPSSWQFYTYIYVYISLYIYDYIWIPLAKAPSNQLSPTQAPQVQRFGSQTWLAGKPLKIHCPWLVWGFRSGPPCSKCRFPFFRCASSNPLWKSEADILRRPSLQGQSHGTAIEPGTTPPILLWIGWKKQSYSNTRTLLRVITYSELELHDGDEIDALKFPRSNSCQEKYILFQN